MPIEFTCPHCQKTTSVANEFAGQTGPCQMCGQTITIPRFGGFTGDQQNTPPAHKSGGGGTSATIVVAVVLVLCCVLAIPCIGIGTALVLPGVQVARQSARQLSSQNNLRQISIALMVYHDTNNTLPPAYIADENGTPRTSWRASLLPFLEQSHLADQYSFNHSWDSAENSFVQSIDIPVYHSPSSPEPITNTSYFFVTGPGTMFEDGRAPKLRDVHDGLSNTIVAVEVQGLDTNWSEPRDITYDELVQLIDSGQISTDPKGFNALMADGDVRVIPLDIDRSTLKALTTHTGGELVSPP